MNKKEYDFRTRTAKNGGSYYEHQGHILFYIPSLPKLSSLSNESKELLKIYKRELAKYKKNVKRQYILETQIFEEAGTYRGVNPYVKTYQPFVEFKTYEQLMNAGGIEKLSSYYGRLKRQSSSLYYRRMFKNNYITVMTNVLDNVRPYLSKEQLRQFTVAIHKLERMSIREFIRLYNIGALPDIDDWYFKSGGRVNLEYIDKMIEWINRGLKQSNLNKKPKQRNTKQRNTKRK